MTVTRIKWKFKTHIHLSIYDIVDGKWSNFGEYEECSKSCGGGIMKRFRTCTNPAPAHGGKKCIGTNVHLKACNTKPCPGD